MFRKSKTPSITSSSIPDRESVTASLHPSWDSSRPVRSPTAAQRRQPDTGVGLARLLETYDDYPNIVQELETTTEQLRLAEEQAHEAELQRYDKEKELQKEKEGREADAAQAKKDKSDAEVAREKKIRGDLEPKIKDLERKLKTMTGERDKLKKEVADLRLQSQKWIVGIENLHKERQLIEDRENKAAEERKKVDEKRKELEKTILEGLKEASTVPADVGEDGEAKKASVTAEKSSTSQAIAEKETTTKSNS